MLTYLGKPFNYTYYCFRKTGDAEAVYMHKFVKASDLGDSGDRSFGAQADALAEKQEEIIT